MERIDPFAPDSDANWCTNDGVHRNGLDAAGNPINGTPKARNSCTNRPPIADAGLDQEVDVGERVQLDGSGSFDPDGDSLSYSWAFISKPSGSMAALSESPIVDPTF
ncbi:MAG: PKD domain-containing protein, partial [Candidatus Bipolaricaulia bacterium]